MAPTSARPLLFPCLVLATIASLLGAHVLQAQVTVGTAISPGSQTTTYPTQTWTVDACINNGDDVVRPNGAYFSLDGVRVFPATRELIADPWCYQAYQFTGTFSLVPGNTNRFRASVPAYSSLAGVDSATYTYLYIKPVITPSDFYTVNRSALASDVAVFTVRNAGNVTGTIALTKACSGVVASCQAPSVSSVTLAPGAQASVTVPYTIAFAGGDGNVKLRGVAADPTAMQDEGASTISVNPPLSKLAMTPKGAAGMPLPAGHATQHGFTANAWGSNYRETVSLTVSCTPAGAICSIPQSTVQVPENTSESFTVNLTTPNTANVSGQLRVIGTVNNTAIADTGYINYSTVTGWQNAFAIYPHRTDTLLITPEKGDSVKFTLANTSASGTDTYTFSTSCDAAAIASCPPPATITNLAAGVGVEKWAKVVARDSLSKRGQLRITATSQTITSLMHTATVNFRTRDRYPIMPRRASLTVAPGSDSAVTFNIQNQRKAEDGSAFFIEFVCPAVVQCTHMLSGSFTIERESISQDFRVAFHAGTIAGQGVITVVARSVLTGAADSAFYTVSVGQAIANSAPHSAPVVTIAAEQGDWRFKDPSKCLLDCFDAVQRYSTVPYYSLNAARSLTFTQRAIAWRPALMLEFDVEDVSSQPADSFIVVLRRPNGSHVPLQTGEYSHNWRDTLFFRRGGATKFRIAIAPRVENDPTGVYDATAIITGFWTATDFQSRSIPLRYVVRNERQSPFGKGWMLEGYQTLKSVSGGQLVLDGSGGWTYFGRADSSCTVGCQYLHTKGDFSVLRDSVSGTTPAGYVRTYPDGSRVVFGLDGKMQASRDPFGNTTSFLYGGSYYPSNLLTSIVDPAGKAFVLQYGSSDYECQGAVPAAPWCGPSWLFMSITDPASRVTRAYINSYGLLYKLKDVDGVERSVYDYPMHDRLGEPWTNSTSAMFGRKLSATLTPAVIAEGVNQRLATSFNPRETQLLGSVNWYYGSSLSATLRVINADTIRASVVDPKGNTTTYRLDGFGAPTEILTADGARTFISRDDEGRVRRIINPRGDTLYYEWKGPYLVNTTDVGASRAQTDLQFSPAVTDVAFTGGHPVQVKSLQNGIVTGTSWFSAAGALDSARAGPDTSQSITRYVTDSRGRVTQVTDPRGHKTFAVYQATGFQNTDSTYAEARLTGTRFYYDVLGRVVASRDPQLVRDTTAYDSLNRVTYSAKAGRTIAHVYGSSSYSVTVNGVSHSTDVFNGLGWLTNKYYNTAPWQTLSHKYDRNGNVTSSINGRGQTTSAGYDALDRPTTLTADGLTTNFFYDPQDRFSGTVRGVNRDTVKTDLAGRASEVVTVRNGKVFTQSLAYDGDGHRRTHTLKAPGYNITTSTFYDQQGRLDTLLDRSGLGVTTLSYNQDGGLVNRKAPGLDLQTGTSGAHAPTALLYSIPGFNREYAYEPRTGFISDRIRPDTLTGHRYSYDVLGQLELVRRYTLPTVTGCDRVDEATGAMADECAAKNPALILQPEQSYTYDSRGNRTDHGGSAYPNNRQDAFNGMTFSYDNDGNMVRKRFANGLHRFTWAATGELTSVTRFGPDTVTVLETVTFTYDGFGRRIKKNSSLGSSREYIHDGDNLLAEVNSAGQVVSQYTNYPGVDAPHSVTYNGQAYYFAIEAPGNVTGLVTPEGVVAASWGYDPWGVPHTRSGADSLPMALRFAAREYDAETGLYYNRARYYDPATGRFISEDPIGLAGGINQYAYAGNNPINATDPSGMICTLWWMTYSQGGVERSYWEHSGDCVGGINGGFPARPSGINYGEVSSWDSRPSGGGALGATTSERILKKGPGCSAAAIDAGLATAGDLVSLTGFGMMATRGTRGARLGMKALRASQWLVRDRLTGMLAPSNSGRGLRSISQWSTNAMVGVSWNTASNAIQGDPLLDLVDEAFDLIPIVNAYRKISSAISQCF